MLLINNIVGSDTRTLTPDETLQSYFKINMKRQMSESNEKSWDNKYKNIYNSIKHNNALIDEVLNIPERARIVRKTKKEICAISFCEKRKQLAFLQLLF